MPIKTIIQTRQGSFVGDLLETTTEVISTTVLSPVIPPQGPVAFSGEWTTNTLDFTDTDPSIGIIKFNADPVVPANITILYIDNWDDLGVYQRDDLRKFRAGDPIIVVDTPAKAMSFLVTGIPDISDTGYVKIPVSFEQGMGTVGNTSNVDVTGVIDSDGGQTTPAITEDILITTGYIMGNAWFLNNVGDLRHILSALNDRVNTIERTFLEDDIFLSREGVLFIQQTDTGPSLDWGPL